MKSLRSCFYQVAAGTNLFNKNEALQWAAENGQTETVRTLLANGADVSRDRTNLRVLVIRSGPKSRPAAPGTPVSVIGKPDGMPAPVVESWYAKGRPGIGIQQRGDGGRRDGRVIHQGEQHTVGVGGHGAQTESPRAHHFFKDSRTIRFVPWSPNGVQTPRALSLSSSRLELVVT